MAKIFVDEGGLLSVGTPGSTFLLFDRQSYYKENDSYFYLRKGGSSIRVRKNGVSNYENEDGEAYTVETLRVFLGNYFETDAHAVIGTVNQDGPSANVVSQFTLEFSTDNTSTLAEGKVKYNDSNPNAVAEIYMSGVSSTGKNLSQYITKLKDGDVLVSQQETDSETFTTFTVIGEPVLDTGMWTISVQIGLDAGVLPSNGATMALQFIYFSNNIKSGQNPNDDGRSGYSSTGAFAGKPASNNYVWQENDAATSGISYTTDDVSNGIFKVFSLDETVHQAVDNPYWSDPTPTGSSGIGLFQGEHLPSGVTSLLDYTFDYDTSGARVIELGEEQVTKGDFTSPGKFTTQLGWDIDEVATTLVNDGTVFGNGADRRTYQNAALIAGRTYQIQFDILNFSGTGNLGVNVGNQQTSVINNADLSVGTVSLSIECVGNAFFYIHIDGSALQIEIDNLSIKEEIPSSGFEGSVGRIRLNDLQYGDQLRVRFDYNVIPQIANTTIQPALWYANRDATDNITFTFPLTTTPVFYGEGTVGKTYLNRSEISAWIVSAEDINALTLPAIKSDNPVIIQPLSMLITIIR